NSVMSQALTQVPLKHSRPVGQMPIGFGLPVQSVGCASQTFGIGITSPEHTIAPFLQAVMPGAQGGAGPVCGDVVALSGLSGTHGLPPTMPMRGSTRLLSTRPSQSSSTLLQTSGPGPTSWVQVRPFGPGPRTPLQAKVALHGPS